MSENEDAIWVDIIATGMELESTPTEIVRFLRESNRERGAGKQDVEYFSEEDVRAVLRQSTIERGALQAIATKLRMGASWLSDIRSGKRSMNSRVAAELGFEKREVYVRIAKRTR